MLPSRAFSTRLRTRAVMPDRPAGANADADGTSVAFNQFNILISRVVRLFCSAADLI
jgi:hypothetical protein